ncbi:MAG TPA: SpoIIE family protein phosphatase, partial [Gallionella sp.]|nr:SpoIIE family protein phosphatase [Gallionella sp.]
EGPEHGRMIELDSKPVTIGRALPADIVLRDVEMSRSHCRLHLQLDEVTVTDLGSTNGTFVNGKQIAGQARLPHGSFLQIGRHLLKHERRGRREIEQNRDFDRSLEGASRYIQSLLPPPMSTGPVRTEWLLLPSTRLGGDALGYQQLDDDTFALYLLDVSGHGVEAAMLAVAVMNVLRQKALPDTNLRQPAQVIAKLNAMFQMDTHSSMYFTIWYGVFQSSRRLLSYSSAGHHPAYLVPESRREMMPLRTPNIAVGIAGNYSFSSETVHVPPQSMLYLFSDGVFEIVTAEGNQWEIKDFLPLLTEPMISGMAEPQRIYQAVQRVARRGPLEDDFSLLAVGFA